jgi:CheY-like chemotaxis protein
MTGAAFSRGSADACSLLIVDDDEQILAALGKLLTEEGHQVSTASDPRTALDLLRASPVDLLIADYRMPEMTGLELIQDARRLQPDLTAILITGFAAPEATVEAAESGTYDLMFKPLNMAEVRLRIRNALERLRLLREVRGYRDALERARLDAGPEVGTGGPWATSSRPELYFPGSSPHGRSPNREAVLDQFERVAKLYQMGLVTKEEFARQKARFLSKF